MRRTVSAAWNLVLRQKEKNCVWKLERRRSLSYSFLHDKRKKKGFPLSLKKEYRAVCILMFCVYLCLWRFVVVVVHFWNIQGCDLQPDFTVHKVIWQVPQRLHSINSRKAQTFHRWTFIMDSKSKLMNKSLKPAMCHKSTDLGHYPRQWLKMVIRKSNFKNYIHPKASSEVQLSGQLSELNWLQL